MNNKTKKYLLLSSFLFIYWILFPLTYYLTTYFIVFLTLFFVSLFLHSINFIVCMVKCRFKNGLISIFSIFAAILVIFWLGKTEFYFHQSFKIHLYFSENYQSKCHLEKYKLNNETEEVGFCEINIQKIIGNTTFIIYDSSGEILLSPSNRSVEWKRSIQKSIYSNIITSVNFKSKRIYNKYYEFQITTNDILFLI